VIDARSLKPLVKEDDAERETRHASVEKHKTTLKGRDGGLEGGGE